MGRQPRLYDGIDNRQAGHKADFVHIKDIISKRLSLYTQATKSPDIAQKSNNHYEKLSNRHT